MFTCQSCGLVFAQRNRAEEEPVSLYTRAYAGDEPSAEMEDFHNRLLMQADMRRASIHWSKVLNSAEQEALRIIREQYPQGCAVLDIGCGTGGLLRALKELHYQPYGLDVAQPVVESLRGEGIPTWLGTIDTLAEGWVEPKVCTCFLVLHHLSDPVGFIKTVQTRFPKALFIVVAHNNLDVPGQPSVSRASFPPRTYCWWGARPLQRAMELGGYTATVHAVTPQASEGGMASAKSIYAALRPHMPAFARLLLAFYRNTLSLWGWPRALLMRQRGFSKYLLAVGYPTSAVGKANIEGGNIRLFHSQS